MTQKETASNVFSMEGVRPDDPEKERGLPDLVVEAVTLGNVLFMAHALGVEHAAQGDGSLSSFAVCKRFGSRWLRVQREAIFAAYRAGRASVTAWREAPGKGDAAIESVDEAAAANPKVLLRVTHTALFNPGSDKKALARAIVSVTFPGVGVAHHANRVEVEDVEVDVDEGGEGTT